MLNPNSKQFHERLQKLPHFDYAQDVAKLAARHGETAFMVQAMIDEKLLTKEDACRYWAEPGPDPPNV